MFFLAYTHATQPTKTFQTGSEDTPLGCASGEHA
jgi:hypothetical protein